MQVTSRIHPFLWFDGRALDAARFYVSVFPNSRVRNDTEVSAGPGEGSAFVEFDLDGQLFAAVDGGPMYQFTPAISFVVTCGSQAEIDYYWERLSEDGKPGRCGWLEDRFGVSWQVIPERLGELMSRSPGNVMEALLAMRKIDIGLLEAAAASS